ncbi:MAG: hypothetical protein ABWY07_13480, partial [Burkholderiales bacterium]
GRSILIVRQNECEQTVNPVLMLVDLSLGFGVRMPLSGYLDEMLNTHHQTEFAASPASQRRGSKRNGRRRCVTAPQ